MILTKLFMVSIVMRFFLSRSEYMVKRECSLIRMKKSNSFNYLIDKMMKKALLNKHFKRKFVRIFQILSKKSVFWNFPSKCWHLQKPKKKNTLYISNKYFQLCLRCKPKKTGSRKKKEIKKCISFMNVNVNVSYSSAYRYKVFKI